MRIAEKFWLAPSSALIDLPVQRLPRFGSFEERGQAEAIARNIFEMAKLRVPTPFPGSHSAVKVVRVELSR